MFKRLSAAIITAAMAISCVGMSYSSVVCAADEGVYFSQADLSVNDGEPIRGVDISSILSLEKAGVKFYNEYGRQQDIFKTLSEYGVNYIRVRVWNEPYDSEGNSYGGGNCDLYTAAEVGKRAAEYDMKLLVDIQYSDFWADPEKQTRPKYWQQHDHDTLKGEIYKYTTWVLETISDAGGDIGMVQVGNETNCFFCGETDMYKICDLFSSANKAIRDHDKSILIAHHFANPSTGYYPWYAQVMDECSLDYDVFATSYYPYWHGTTDNLTSVLKDIGDKYDKYVIVAETAYPYTSEDGDTFGNAVSADSSHAEFRYDISVEGQSQSLTDVFKAVSDVGEKGLGVFYWEPAWIGVENISYEEQKKLWEKYGCGWATSYAKEYDSSATDAGGSAYDNQGLFDFSGRPLESMEVFRNIYPQKGSSHKPQGVEITDGTYSIKSLEGGMYISADKNGVCLDAAPKAWSFFKNEDGTYSISTRDGNALTVKDDTAVTLEEYRNYNSQKFILKQNKDGTYSMMSAVSDGRSCIDMNGGNVGHGEYSRVESQNFVLELAEYEITAGDINSDGELTVADIVILQKWIIGKGELSDIETADISGDGTVNILDVCMLRQALLKT